MTTEIITAGVCFLVTATSVIVSIIKGKKGTHSKRLVELAKIVQKIPNFINEAEQILGGGTGAAKLRYVLNQINIECLKSGVEFQEEAFKEEIEKILETPQKKED